MKQLQMVCMASLVMATFLAEDVAARDGVRRPRIVIYAVPRYADEPGTIYGYAPGVYWVRSIGGHLSRSCAVRRRRSLTPGEPGHRHRSRNAPLSRAGEQATGPRWPGGSRFRCD